MRTRGRLRRDRRYEKYLIEIFHYVYNIQADRRTNLSAPVGFFDILWVSFSGDCALKSSELCRYNAVGNILVVRIRV